MSGIRLVTRADDAGLSRSAIRATRAAARQGIVRNVGFMVPAPESADAASTLIDLGDQVDFGLHVCLTSEWPTVRWGPVARPQDVPTLLLPDGTFPRDCAELEALAPSPDEMVAEVIAQYERLRSLGIAPSYLDEHMGVGEVAGLHLSLADLARDWGLVYDRKLAEDGHLSPLPGWKGPGEHPGTELADHLSTLPEGAYLLVGHPAFKGQEMAEIFPPGSAHEDVVIQRNRERRMFTDIEIVDYCETSGIRLLRYTEVV